MRIAVMGSGGLGGYFGARLAKGGGRRAFHRPRQAPRGDARRRSARRRSRADARAARQRHRRPAARRRGRPRDVLRQAVGHRCGARRRSGRWWARTPWSSRSRTACSRTSTCAPRSIRRRSWAASATSPPRSTAPGVIRQTGPMQRLLFGEFDGSRSARAESISAACLAGGIKAELSDCHHARDLAEVRLPGRPVRHHDDDAHDHRTDPREPADPRLPARRHARGGRRRPRQGVDLAENYAEMRLELADEVAHDMTSSMHHDLERGNRLEVRWLSGGVVELGRARACRRR